MQRVCPWNSAGGALQRRRLRVAVSHLHLQPPQTHFVCHSATHKRQIAGGSCASAIAPAVPPGTCHAHAPFGSVYPPPSALFAPAKDPRKKPAKTVGKSHRFLIFFRKGCPRPTPGPSLCSFGAVAISMDGRPMTAPRDNTHTLGSPFLPGSGQGASQLSANLRQLSLASAASNLSARGGLRWSALHGRPLVGKDCTPEAGQRVVGAAKSHLKAMGIGTIVDCAAGFAAVQWDLEHGSARPPNEYCIGYKGIFQLELAQIEDITLGARYESVNGGHHHRFHSLEDLFSQPFGGPHRSRRVRPRPHTTREDSQQSPLTCKEKPVEFLRRSQGPKHALSSVQLGKVNRTLVYLFMRFAKGTKRKRRFGYDLGAVKVQTMQSMNFAELSLCLQYLDVRQDKPFLRPIAVVGAARAPQIISFKSVQAQYAQLTPWSHPDAFGELDFDRFALCLESVSILAGIPFQRFLCVPPHDARGNTIAAKLTAKGVVPEALLPFHLRKDDDDDTDEDGHKTGTLCLKKSPAPFKPSALKATELERHASSASAFYSDFHRLQDIQEVKQAAAKNKADFLAWINSEHKLWRQMKEAASDWSHKFIITSAATAWYDGPDLKVHIKADSPVQLVACLNIKVKRLMDIPADNQLTIKYNITSRSELVAGNDPKWILLDVESLTKLHLPYNGRPFSAGTYIKVLREEDMWAAKMRAIEMWDKIRRTCRILRYQRGGKTGGLFGAAHSSLLKTLETGGSQWIRGDAQRDKLKDALSNFLLKQASDAMASGKIMPKEQTYLLETFLARAKVLAIRTGSLCLIRGKCPVDSQKELSPAERTRDTGAACTTVSFLATANYGVHDSTQGKLHWSEPSSGIIRALTSAKTTAMEAEMTAGKIHCHYFTSWQHASESELSWASKAKAAEEKGAAAIIFMTATKQLVVPEVVGKKLAEDQSLQVQIPVVFVARGAGGDLILEAALTSQAVAINFDPLQAFDEFSASDPGLSVANESKKLG